MPSREVEAALSATARARSLPVPSRWSGCDAFWPLLEEMRRDGAVVVLKLDGERGPDETDGGPYTVVISRGGLGDDFVQRSATSPEEVLASAVLEYARLAWR